MTEVWHVHPSCTAVAFRLRCSLADAEAGVVLSAVMVAYDNGRVITDDSGTGVTGSLIVCQACGRAVAGMRTVGHRLVVV